MNNQIFWLLATGLLTWAVGGGMTASDLNLCGMLIRGCPVRLHCDKSDNIYWVEALL